MSKRDREMLAAIIDLEDVDDDAPAVAVRPPKEPSQVYSIRIPTDRLEELRTVAAARGIAPSQLMRTWVIERLDSAVSRRKLPTERRAAVIAFPVRTDIVELQRLTRASF
ncbi:hypothetical protein [Blastococcus sp. TF02A-30]|uniref:hypothetical protein n=1 Tax=Blastococcus sp. TF02A-30 TaxID=2250580 RepID=UPI000DE89B32|nr:hypothetical protein [Blastococcus sp. TF02A-30]RBY84572.1 hypothetical protein DQ241_18035 [Blastococcus sp. TF02A-30]